MHRVESGNGRPIILVHGWGSSSRTFQHLQPRLARTAHAVAVDLRGFGKTGPVNGTHGIAEMAGDLAELIEETGPAVLVGHSMGGAVVTRLALDRPDLVDGLVVIDPAYGADDKECAGLRQRRADLVSLGAKAPARDSWRAFSLTAPETLRAQVLEELEASDARVLLESFDGMYTAPDAFGQLPQTRLALARRRGPVLALYSTQKAADTEAELSPLSEIAVAPGPGHFVHLEHPDWTESVLLKWLESHFLV